MTPSKKDILDRLLQIMRECEENKLRYYRIENAACAIFEMEAGIDQYDIGKTEEETAKDN